jgi:D-3-phosphoglycerate dehydrogenase
VRLLLTHVPLARRQYYGARALARLQELVEVTLHEGEAPLDPKGLIAAAGDVDLIVADRARRCRAKSSPACPGFRLRSPCEPPRTAPGKWSGSPHRRACW